MLSSAIAGAFETHASDLRHEGIARRENATARNVVETFG